MLWIDLWPLGMVLLLLLALLLYRWNHPVSNVPSPIHKASTEVDVLAEKANKTALFDELPEEEDSPGGHGGSSSGGSGEGGGGDGGD